MQQTSRAIILKKIPYGEADLIVTFFSRDEGRLSGIAKNARASQKRFGGSLELGSVVDLRYTVRHASDIVRIEDAHINIPTVGIMRSLERIGALARALELALAFLPERQSAPEKFDLLSRHISSLAESDPTPSSQIAFEFKWLSYVGYKPLLEECASCGSGLEKKARWSFSMDHGGLCCQDCERPLSRRVPLEGRLLGALQNLAGGEDVVFHQDDSRTVQNLLAHYVQHILGRALVGRVITERW